MQTVLTDISQAFLVDNFRGHKIGDVNHPDYNCAIDTATRCMLRPKAYYTIL